MPAVNFKYLPDRTDSGCGPLGPRGILRMDKAAVETWHATDSAPGSCSGQK